MAGTEAPGAGDPCPECGTSLVSERQAAAWCPACEWNLPVYEPERRHAELGWRWLDRRTHRLAYRLTRRQFAALSGKDVDRPGSGSARIVMVTVGVVLLAAVGAVLLAGGYLVVAYWPHPLAFVGLLLILLAAALHPRLGRLDKDAEQLGRAQAPALHDLVERVAAQLGAARPDVILVDDTFNASCSTVGLRRRRVLRIGLPLWAILPPQQRVALIAHELGHFVNGDLRRGSLSGVPVNTLSALLDITRPERTSGRSHSILTALADLLTRLLLGVLHGLLWCVQILLVWVWLRDGQRAEYLADQLAARAAGSVATVGLLDTLLAGEGMTTAVTAAARRSAETAQWRAAADQTRQNLRERTTALRQLSVRDQASMFASHPPAGLRARLIESRPTVSPAIVLTDGESERLDRELAMWYDRARRDLIHA